MHYRAELSEGFEQKMIVTFKSYFQPRVKTSVFLASKPHLSIVDNLQATFSSDLPVYCIKSS